MKDKIFVQEKMQKLIEMSAEFCNNYLDEDYKQLCEKLIRKMSRKRNIPFLSGREEIWAASIIHAIGSINFLFDKSFKPYATVDDISNFFNTSKTSVSQKAKLIRDMFKLRHYDEEFSTTRMKENNPFKDLIMVNGFIVPKSFLEK